jgi:hypothetical protein
MTHVERHQIATVPFEVELDLSYAPGQPILFYCDVGGRRELGRIPPAAAEYSVAEGIIRQYKALQHLPGNLAGVVPCRMTLEEQRTRKLIRDGHSWGEFARHRPG